MAAPMCVSSSACVCYKFSATSCYVVRAPIALWGNCTPSFAVALRMMQIEDFQSPPYKMTPREPKR